MVTDELKPCPFCGGSALYQRTSEIGITCRDCHAQVLGAGVEDDTTVWNRRAPALAPVQAEGWQTMETAPTNGRHVLLAIPSGAFVWTVEGSFDGHDWNAVHASKVNPLYWAPKTRLPEDWIEYRRSLPAPPATSKGEAE